MTDSSPLVSPAFIIWTLQRTGGTNLTTRLVEWSGRESAPHEPFNPGRVYGDISRQWQESADRAGLHEALAAVVAKGEVIKHCVEMVPLDLTQALALAATRAGYRHLILYRRSALDRLLSLHFAEATGIWGPDMLHQQALDVAPIKVDALLAHEKHCTGLLQRMWNLLDELGTPPLLLAYEDIYQAASLDAAAAALAATVTGLGIDVHGQDFARLARTLVEHGDQGTRHQYRQFPNYAALAKGCSELPAFQPGRKPLHCRPVVASHPWVVAAFVDVLPERIAPGEDVEVGGVCLLSAQAPQIASLQLVTAAGSSDLQWGIDSPRMAEEHPQARNCRHSRWRGNLRLGDADNFAVLELLAADGKRVPLLELLVCPGARALPVPNPAAGQLIFDIGANDGSDTGYYLNKGFDVVAVEAIPGHAQWIRQRYAAALDAGRLRVVQSAVHAQAGEIEFMLNPERTEWSSAHGAAKAFGDASRALRVPAVTLAELIGRYGVPHYVKIDIEGGELDAVRSLQALPGAQLPVHLSFEANPDLFAVLQVLWDIGYRRFQLVRQGWQHLPAPVFP